MNEPDNEQDTPQAPGCFDGTGAPEFFDGPGAPHCMPAGVPDEDEDEDEFFDEDTEAV